MEKTRGNLEVTNGGFCLLIVPLSLLQIPHLNILDWNQSGRRVARATQDDDARPTPSESDVPSSRDQVGDMLSLLNMYIRG